MGFRAKVSFILPVFNGEKYIAQAIESVLKQTLGDWELIVIDDGSKDHTVEMVRTFEDQRIHLIQHEGNRGVCIARNSGIEAAQGAWIAHLDADDAWHETRLEKLLKISESFPEAFIGSDVMICFSGQNHELIPWKTLFQDRQLKTERLYFPTPADLVRYGLDVKPLFPTEVVRKQGIAFREDFRGHEWLYTLLKLYQAGLRYIILNEPLYYYRLTPGSDSTTYACIQTQVNACAYLQSADGLDEETRCLIRKEAKICRYRLFTAALRERRWEKALQHFLKSPMSFFYGLGRVPGWLSRRKRSQELCNNPWPEGTLEP